MTHKKKTPKPAQHLTAERLHDLARKWKRAQSAERAVALFTYSREHGGAEARELLAAHPRLVLSFFPKSDRRPWHTI